ncbi:hypothetical protein HMPREF1054_1938 [Haemophilus paraphrohaemolyticus HK411]|uniref:Uncharacterized protein n=1 Tax=Haemophilus paraphrohaemolyticus HK411 TaxID=1095743 RepID=I2NDH6_9PAST|nr:hypothetical protein HMPREF1054_1938 [Haemophilus paraphrohaemolyticus HK411]
MQNQTACCLFFIKPLSFFCGSRYANGSLFAANLTLKYSKLCLF